MSSASGPSIDSFAEASRPFVAALRGHDAVVRAVALQEIAPVVDDSLARELLRFARTSEASAEERGQAVIALGPALEETSYEEAEDGSLAPPPGPEEWWETPLSEAGYREVHDELRRIYHDGGAPKEVRRRALEAAVRAPRPWQRDAVATAWASGDPEWRVTAMFAMGLLRGFDEQIEAALRDADPLVRRQALRAVGTSELEHLGPQLLAVVSDRSADPDQRSAAIAALGELRPEGAEDLLEELADDEGEDEDVREAAEDALDEIRTWSGMGDLSEDFDLGGDWES